MEKNIQKNKAVIYCRVSTKEQAEEGNSLATQERNCREYAQKHGYEIAEIFIEEGESAKTADRTELQKLLRFCSNRKENIKAVIIYKIDRLSRNTDDYSQLRILLKRYDTEIKSTTEYFENTPAGRFMENIIANVAQFDNDVRTERSVGGMKDAVREGRYVWVAPVGYKNQKVNGKATIVPSDNAPIVKQAFVMMAERKYTIDATIKILTDLGLVTRAGKPISRSAFYTVLKNELYAGWINQFGERHKGKFEPLVSDELFNRVQNVMRNKKTPTIYRKENPDFPLRRFVRHPQHPKLTGAWSKGRYKRYAYYRFIGTHLYWTKDYLEKKFQTFMDEFSFDGLLWNRLKKELLIRFTNNSNTGEKGYEEQYLMKQRLKEKQKILLQKNLNGVVPDALLREQLSLLDEEIWNIDKMLLQKEDNKIEIKEILDFIGEYLQHPSRTWNEMPFHIKLDLQWFQFPAGITFDGNKFRTTKISSLFKLKQFFLADSSFYVHHSRLNYEHRNQTKYSQLKNKKSIAWDELLKELRTLEQVLKSTDKSNDCHQLSNQLIFGPEELSPG